MARAPLDTHRKARPRRRVALILQGGGALGAYHVGAYEALHEAGVLDSAGSTLDWVAGISIGAFNASIIAGNPPERRLERLTEFWSAVSRPDDWGTPLHDYAPKLYNQWSYWGALMFGQPNFFFPRLPGPYFLPQGAPGATSFYETAPLRQTLERVTDFAFINRGPHPSPDSAPAEASPPRISLGATNVETGELRFFDNTRDRIGPEHVMASGSLPPGFPAQHIDGHHYWDGACVSNTALDALLDDPSPDPVLAFVIDLWSPSGPTPTTMDDVQWRQKQIQYASRTEHAIRSLGIRHELRSLLNARKEAPPAGEAALPEDAALTGKRLDIVHIVYHPEAEQVPGSDAEFSRLSIAERRAAGLADMRKALELAPWTRDEPATAPMRASGRRGGWTEGRAGGTTPNSAHVHLIADGALLRSTTGAELAQDQVPSTAEVMRQASTRRDGP